MVMVVADGSAPARSDFLNYALSLMRSHNSEHGDSLPVVDVSALKHVAYIFDALINYVRVTADASILLDLKKEARDRAKSTSVTWQDRVKEGMESLAKDFPTVRLIKRILLSNLFRFRPFIP